MCLKKWQVFKVNSSINVQSMTELELIAYLIVIASIVLTILIIAIAVLFIVKGRDWKKGAVPTTEEIASKKVKDLAERLESGSKEKTLTNILEWQHRNITFWLERYPMPQITGAFLVIFVLCLVALYNSVMRKSGAWLVATCFSLVFLAMTIASIAITLVYVCYGRHLKLGLFWNTLKASVPIDDIIEYRVCVCRDYAKLTACLLLNLFPKSDIYFAHTSNHVAVGIISNGQLYMLDQKLPLLTIHQWDKKVESKETIHKLSDGKIELIKDISNFNNNSIDLTSLRKELIRILNANEELATNRSLVKVLNWRRGALLYTMNDDVVNYSLSQRIKFECLTELMELEKMCLKVEENNDDLHFFIYEYEK